MERKKYCKPVIISMEKLSKARGDTACEQGSSPGFAACETGDDAGSDCLAGSVAGSAIPARCEGGSVPNGDCVGGSVPA